MASQDMGFKKPGFVVMASTCFRISSASFCASVCLAVCLSRGGSPGHARHAFVKLHVRTPRPFEGGGRKPSGIPMASVVISSRPALTQAFQASAAEDGHFF